MKSSRPALPRYTAVAMLLHWSIALLILGMIPLGLYMSDLLPSLLKLKLTNWHKWSGISVLLLAVLRLGWRAGHRPPPLPASIPGWQQRAAAGLHWLLYGLLFAMPLSGWAMSSAAGYQVVWWGVWPLPNLLPVDKQLAHQLRQLHELLNDGLMAALALHLAAAFKHQFIDRDRVLERMLPGRRR